MRISALFVVLSLSSSIAFASTTAPKGMRLIETGADNAEWMTFDQIADLSRASHAAGKCGGFIDVTDHQDLAPLEYLRPFSVDFGGRVPTQQDIIEPLLPELSAQELHNFVEKLSSFPTRFLRSDSGVESMKWVRKQFEQMSAGRNDVTIEMVSHRFKQPSVIVRVEGTHPELKNEIVVIGAHGDSVNWGMVQPRPDEPAPGADDDASGVGTVLETFRVLMASGYQPQRSLEFMIYAGEEMGLLGSQDIVSRYQKEGKVILGVLQLDMTLHPSKTKEITMITDHVDPTLTQFAKMLVDTYVKVPWKDGRCGYGCSDHASWTKAGYASVFPFESSFEESNKNIHTERDTIANGLDFSFGLHFAKLALAYAVEMTQENR